MTCRRDDTPGPDGGQRPPAYTARHGQPRPRAPRHPAERPAAGRTAVRRARRDDRPARRRCWSASTRCAASTSSGQISGDLRHPPPRLRVEPRRGALAARAHRRDGRRLQRPPGRHAQLPARPRLRPLVHDRRAAQLAARPRADRRPARATSRTSSRSAAARPALLQDRRRPRHGGGRNPGAKKERREPDAADPGAETLDASGTSTRPGAADRPAGGQRAVPRDRRGLRLHGRGAARRRATSTWRPGRCGASPPCSPTATPASCRTAWACGRSTRTAARRWARSWPATAASPTATSARSTRTGRTASSR